MYQGGASYRLILKWLAHKNVKLFVYGSIHQGHGRFSWKSRGKQCAFMSLSAGEIQTAYICRCVRKLT